MKRPKNIKSKLPTSIKLHWGYLIFTLILCVIFYVGSLLLYPEWKNINGWTFALLIIVVSATVQFVANLRAVIEPSTRNNTQQNKVDKSKQGSEDRMKKEECDAIERRLIAAQKILSVLEEKASRFPITDIPATLTLDLEEKRKEVSSLKEELKICLGGNNE